VTSLLSPQQPAEVIRDQAEKRERLAAVIKYLFQNAQTPVFATSADQVIGQIEVRDLAAVCDEFFDKVAPMTLCGNAAVESFLSPSSDVEHPDRQA
jgi:hypothetical protein